PSVDDGSPIAELVANALAEGYTQRGEPYHGYHFKILTGQGANAPGGAMSYLNNGDMTGGFAMIAWPSEYESTGVMTFLVSRNGIVYQKDLGPTTQAMASAVAAYNPDRTWNPVSDYGIPKTGTASRKAPR